VILTPGVEWNGMTLPQDSMPIGLGITLLSQVHSIHHLLCSNPTRDKVGRELFGKKAAALCDRRPTPNPGGGLPLRPALLAHGISPDGRARSRSRGAPSVCVSSRGEEKNGSREEKQDEQHEPGRVGFVVHEPPCRVILNVKH